MSIILIKSRKKSEREVPGAARETLSKMPAFAKRLGGGQFRRRGFRQLCHDCFNARSPRAEADKPPKLNFRPSRPSFEQKAHFARSARRNLEPNSRSDGERGRGACKDSRRRACFQLFLQNLLTELATYGIMQMR